MKLAAITLFIYSSVILLGSWMAFWSVGSLASLVGGFLCALALLGCGWYALRGVVVGGYVGGIVTFFAAIYFAYRLISSQRFVPSGILLMVSFAALFAITLGVFLGLQEHRD